MSILVLSGLYVYNQQIRVTQSTTVSSQQTRVAQSTTVPIKVLATFYPVCDFAKNIAGDRISLSLLVPMTEDVHEFEPTPGLVQELSSANVLIFSGAQLEPWIPQVVVAANNPRLVVIDSSQGITLLPIQSRFQAEGRVVDPHIWLDPVLAKQQVMNILKGLINADPTDREYFTANALQYASKLDALNQQFVNLASNAKTKYFVTFHEAFGYFAKRYGLTQIPILGPFEEDPGPSNIQDVITAIRTNHLCYVGYESLENPAIAQGVASQTHATLIHMDPIEGLTQSDQAAGKTYLIKMQDNLASFTLALGSVGC